MIDGLIHRQPLRLRLLTGHDDVDVVAGAQAVVVGGEQRIGVNGQINAYDFCFLVDDMVDEAGILMRKTVVVLPPDVTR